MRERLQSHEQTNRHMRSLKTTLRSAGMLCMLFVASIAVTVALIVLEIRDYYRARYA